MVDFETNLRIESSKDGFSLKIGDHIEVTDQELVEILSDEDISRIQELQLVKKREQYEKKKPVGFEYAPESAKKKREEYENTNNLEKLQWIQNNVSYNFDGTMNILKLHKTFCEDLSGTEQKCNWEEAKQLAESKGYALPSDYNDCDSDEVKQGSDWYKVINIFSNGHGDTREGIECFRDIAGCNSRYWTTTPYKDEKGKSVSGVARSRSLSKASCSRCWNYARYSGRVCGFKDMD